MKNPLSFLVQQLLKANKITVDFDELDFQIQSHPTYPSLHAVTGVLDHFNIENLALDVPKTIDTFNQLPTTFLAQLEIDSQKQFVVITKIKNGCKITLGGTQKETLSEFEFLNQFTGILLAVEKDTTTTMSSGSLLNPNLLKGLVLTTLIAFALMLILSKPSTIDLGFLCLSIIGIYISISVFKQEQGESNILVDAFCSNPSEKKSCNAVLNSKAAIIYKNLKLSDISITYFTGLALAISFLSLSSKAIFIPKLISLMVLPITIYSIYFQSVVIKKWCFLCLSIVAVMWCQSCFNILSFQPIYDIESTLISVLSFSCTGILWLLGSKFFKDNKSLKKIKIDYYKFKRNFDLFFTQLDKSKTINTYIKSKEEIVFGNSNSNLNILIITNPLCGHCKPVHNTIEQIISNYPQLTKLTIRFNINPEHPENTAVKIATRLLELYNTKSIETCLNAMHDIYGDSSPSEWLKKWNECSQPNNYLPILRDQFNWCSDNSINFTPEILINGKSYPKMFDRNDLIYFIENLEELSEVNSPHIPFIKAEKA
ncbi:vitamin K epoxide reductase family protein [Winogradskyella flava]|uniref:vitamin K epoxide reductase family protein n=1 Tax=Winogradskyella flava TaxID=1884876 RepID=UPI0024939BCB|nr:vitamin K epoxide reductase family protein [Winogradskyella flava]